MDWKNIIRLFNDTYRYYDEHKNLMMMYRLDVIFCKYEKGDRSKKLYGEILTIIRDEYDWQEV